MNDDFDIQDDPVYTGIHTHPLIPIVIEFVAYERIDDSWDVYVYEPVGSCPELESSRVDNYHIFVERIEHINEFHRVVFQTEAILGKGYRRSAYYREYKSRKIIQKILQHLKKSGAHGMHVQSLPPLSPEEWTLYIRNKDFDLASEFIESNL